MPPNFLINRREEEKVRDRVVSLQHSLEVEASRAVAESGPEVAGVGGLGLRVVRQDVLVAAGEDLATRHGARSVLGPDLLDVVLVKRVDNGGDVKEGDVLHGAEGELAEHARVGVVGHTLSDGVEVALVDGREVDGDVLGVVDLDGGNLGRAGRGGEVDGALKAVQGPEGDRVGGDGGGGGNEAGEHGRELHLEGRSSW